MLLNSTSISPHAVTACYVCLNRFSLFFTPFISCILYTHCQLGTCFQMPCKLVELTLFKGHAVINTACLRTFSPLIVCSITPLLDYFITQKSSHSLNQVLPQQKPKNCWRPRGHSCVLPRYVEQPPSQ